MIALLVGALVLFIVLVGLSYLFDSYKDTFKAYYDEYRANNLKRKQAAYQLSKAIEARKEEGRKLSLSTPKLPPRPTSTRPRQSTKKLSQLQKSTKAKALSTKVKRGEVLTTKDLMDVLEGRNPTFGKQISADADEALNEALADLKDMEKKYFSDDQW